MTEPAPMPLSTLLNELYAIQKTLAKWRSEATHKAVINNLVSLLPDIMAALEGREDALEQAHIWRTTQSSDRRHAAAKRMAELIEAAPPSPVEAAASEEDAPFTQGEGQATLIRVAQTMRHALTFIDSKERMHPDGVKLYRIDLACLESLADDFAAQPPPPSEEDAALIEEADAALDRWLDREHHSFPSHPLASSVAIILSERRALDSRLKTLRNEHKEPER